MRSLSTLGALREALFPFGNGPAATSQNGRGGLAFPNMAPHLTRIRLEHWLLSAILLLALGLRVAAIDYDCLLYTSRCV